MNIFKFGGVGDQTWETSGYSDHPALCRTGSQDHPPHVELPAVLARSGSAAAGTAATGSASPLTRSLPRIQERKSRDTDFQLNDLATSITYQCNRNWCLMANSFAFERPSFHTLGDGDLFSIFLKTAAFSKRLCCFSLPTIFE